jgi:hypothetical protein
VIPSGFFFLNLNFSDFASLANIPKKVGITIKKWREVFRTYLNINLRKYITKLKNQSSIVASFFSKHSFVRNLANCFRNFDFLNLFLAFWRNFSPKKTAGVTYLHMDTSFLKTFLWFY